VGIPDQRDTNNPSIEVLRHRAAIRRTEPSLPVKCLLRDSLLTRETTFFDFGCGYGDDLNYVAGLGLEASGWDPTHRPNGICSKCDVVNLGYVINVIEDIAEREDVLKSAWKITRAVLAVTARIAVDGNSEGLYEFGDGVITRLQTFQKYFTQSELRGFVEQALNTEALPAAPGVFYVFKDAKLREAFLASKYRRRTNIPRQRNSVIEFRRHRKLLEPMLTVLATLGRIPFEDELDDAHKICDAFGSIKRAFNLVRKVTGGPAWNALQQSRSDDLRVYLALARFNKRPRFSKLPLSMQRDIKAFFGSYKKACASADELLFDAGCSARIDEACKRSKLGRLTSNALYLHRSATSSLEPVLRVFEGCGNTYIGDIEDANVVKLHRFSGKISYLACPEFEELPHPPIRRTIKLSLRNLYLQCFDHSGNKNPLLLDHKERMIEVDHPWRDRFARFSMLEMQHGLLSESTDMLSESQWQNKLQEAGLTIRGYRLFYLKGVKRKRLPSRQSLTSSDDIFTNEISFPDESFGIDDPRRHEASPWIDADIESESSEAGGSFELPARSKRFGVGKEIGYAVYVHRDYEEVLGSNIEWAKRHLPDSYDYNVVKFNQRNDSFSFIHCPGFDNVHEPVVEGVIVVNADGTAKRRTLPSDSYIYHHKWLFVADDYRGFDVEESKARSQEWISLGDVDRSRIGQQYYWTNYVVPRLKANPPTRWLQSSEIRRELKISTCDLAHMRNAGSITSKKVGNAYFYKMPNEHNGQI